MDPMQANDAWIAMFRRIPADLQDALSLGMATGAEIVVQKIVRLDPDFMIIRGRLAGTQDPGRIVFIPYGQLTFVAVTRELKDNEVEATFGIGVAPQTTPTAAAPAPAAQEATLNDAQAAANPLKKPDAASRSALVAKMRDRLKDPGQGGK